MQKTKGFSLLETIVAIIILMTALIGFYDLAIFSGGKIGRSKNEIIAFFLAQEAQEYVSNLRMSNGIKGDPWLQGLLDCNGANGCFIDATNGNVAPCSSSCPKIRFDQTAGYNYTLGAEKPFSRKITIEEIVPPTGLIKEAKVKVEMQWSEKGQNRSFILENRLFKWI